MTNPTLIKPQKKNLNQVAISNKKIAEVERLKEENAELRKKIGFLKREAASMKKHVKMIKNQINELETALDIEDEVERQREFEKITAKTLKLFKVESIEELILI
jgi:hypothetical protein